MNISPRFTEFGMTGAFFLLSQLCVIIFVLDPAVVAKAAAQNWASALNSYQAHLPELLRDTTNSLFTVVGVISIFVTGLILDLIGSYFAFLEMILFSRHLRRNRAWLNDMADHCQETVRRDYQQLRDDFGTGYLVGPRQLWQRFQMSSAYNNLQAFLYSHIQVFSSMPGTLVDNMHLWRTSRAVSTTLLILSVEVYFFNGNSHQAWLVFVLLFILSAVITLRSYSRLCFTLFSMACVTQHKIAGAHPAR